jgi:RHS repeat-associated protein
MEKKIEMLPDLLIDMDSLKAHRHNAASVTHDANGNMTTWGDDTYTWDMAGRLASVSNTSDTIASYTYDAFNRRVSKTVDDVTTTFVYDGWDVVLELVDGVRSAYYVRTRKMDEPLARIELASNGDATLRYYHQDVQGSVVALSNEDGSITTSYTYSPFGNVNTTHIIGNVTNPILYTGQYYDVETNQYYMKNRYYSSQMGRFITEDPLAFGAGDLNFYRYVGNNPVNFVDPLGLWKKDVHYYLTLQLALEGGCSSGVAHLIANGNQAMDEMDSTKPWTFKNYRQYHYRNLEDGEQMVNSAGTPTKFGNALHTVQDYYSHVASERKKTNLKEDIFR